MGTLIGLKASVGSTYAAAAADHGLTVAAAAIDAAFPAIYRSAPPLAFPGLEGAELERAERRWWGEDGWQWLQAKGRRAPRGVEQWQGAVVVQRHGRE